MISRAPDGLSNLIRQREIIPSLKKNKKKRKRKEKGEERKKERRKKEGEKEKGKRIIRIA
jgi:hypothetical protein